MGFKSDIVFGVTSESKIVCSYYGPGDYTPRFNSTILGYVDVIDAIYVSPYLVVLHSNGTISMEYVDNDKYTKEDEKAYELQIAEEVKTWDEIVCVQECAGGIIGIKVDGTVKYVSTDIYAYDSSSGWKYLYDTNDDVKAEIESWTDIVWVTGSVQEGIYGDNGFVGEYAVGIKINGSMVATGDGDYYTIEKNTYGDLYDKGHSGGTYHLVGGWKLWE